MSSGRQIDVRIEGRRAGTVRVIVELPAELGVMLEQLALIEGVPKKLTIRRALEELREEIRERGIGVLFEEGEPAEP